jgi:small-conductance mechanosensitive channel
MDLSNAYNLILGKLETWISTSIEMLPNILMAILVLVIFYALGKIIRKTVTSILDKTTNNKAIIHLLESIVGTIVILIGVFIALGILNLDGTVKSLLAGAGIIGLALGFAFQDIASNFISGMLLSIRHPFGIGDIIDTNGYYGTVVKMNLRNTVLLTPQGQRVFLPNKMVFESPFENYTSESRRRIDLSCGVSYGDDLEKAKKLAIQAVESINSYDTTRPVELYYNEFGDSSINYVIRFWVNFNTNNDFWNAQSDAIMAIKKLYDDEDIMIPFPIRTLDFGIRGGEQLHTMVEKSGWKKKN